MKDATFAATLAVSSLESIFRKPSLIELRVNTERIEKEIRTLTSKAFISYFSQLKNFRTHDKQEFLLNGRLYRISIGSAVSKPTLQICIIDSLEPNTSRSSSGIIPINGIGYFSEFEIEIAAKISSHLTSLTEQTKSIYLASYSWLEQELLRNISAIEKDFTAELYRHLRIILAPTQHDALAEKVWFSIFSEANGHYALDTGAIKNVVKILKKRRYSSEYSPLWHSIELIGLEMPYKQSLSQYAIADKRYHELQLKKAVYKSEKRGIYKTEEQMVEGGAYAIFPLGQIGDQRLVAGFPSGLRETLLPIFHDNAERLQEIFALQHKGLRKHIIHAQSCYKRMDTADLGGLIGGIIGGIFKNL